MNFEDFARSHAAELVSMAWALTGDLGGGEDVVQGVLLDMWRHWTRISSRDDVLRYARAAVIRRSKGWHRQRLRYPQRKHIELHTPAIEDSSEDVERRMLLMEWLSHCTNRERETVVLRFLCDQSVDDTAVILGCGVGTVKSQTARALAKMRAFGNEEMKTP